MPQNLENAIAAAFAALPGYDFGRSTEVLERIEEFVREAKGRSEVADLLGRELNRTLETETPLAVRQFACKMIWMLGPDCAAPGLEKLLSSPDARLVEAACFAIGCAPSPAMDRLLARAGERAQGPAQPTIQNLIARRARFAAPPGALFNGRDLSEWTIDTPGIWQVRNGVIIGRSPGLRYNDFLRTRKSYADFVLRARIRMIDGVGNSGIQFRSRPAQAPHELEGYQADAGERYWGSLYDESRRNKTLAGPGEGFLDRFDPTVWHSYVVSARGRHIRLELDGVVTADYEERDPGIPGDGILALQVHAWPGPVEVWFRDLTIEVL